MQRDWSSLANRLPSLAWLALALALVTSPFWLFPHAGETRYVYTADEIDYENEPQTYLRARGELARLDCYSLDSFGPGCLLAAHVAQNGPITVESTAFGRRYETGTEYVVVEDDMTPAPFYRRVVDKNETRVTYSLEQVTPGAILRNVSLAESEVSEKARRVLRGETVETYGDPLPEAGQVVRSNGTYYVVRERGHWRSERTELEATAWRAIALGAGLAMLRRRWRGSS